MAGNFTCVRSRPAAAPAAAGARTAGRRRAGGSRLQSRADADARLITQDPLRRGDLPVALKDEPCPGIGVAPGGLAPERDLRLAQGGGGGEPILEHGVIEA